MLARANDAYAPTTELYTLHLEPVSEENEPRLKSCQLPSAEPTDRRATLLGIITALWIHPRPPLRLVLVSKRAPLPDSPLPPALRIPSPSPDP